MRALDYVIVGEFCNETQSDLSLFLELVPEQVVLSPGHSVELLAKPSDDLLPLTINLVEGGLQIYAHKEYVPDWHVRFNGKVIVTQALLILKEHE
jgi:hypothetical protein